MTFAGRGALVTGAGSGIGRAAAVMLADRGVGVAIADVDQEGGRGTAAMIEEAGGEAVFVPCDVTDEASVAALVAATIDEFGSLDYAFNNAGVHELPALLDLVDIDVESFRRVLDVNVTGVFLCMKHELRHMRTRRSGSIVNTSSRNGLVGTSAHTGYTASKHGVLGLTKVAALDNARYGIRINAVCPGPVATPMMTRLTGDPDQFDFSPITPARRAASPDEIAEAALWLLGEASSYVNGHALSVDGGMCAQ